MEKPTHAIFIPEPVRYDDRLSPIHKIMYGEFVHYCKDGYFETSKSFFAKLYNVSTNTVASWIKTLETCGYIRSESVIQSNGGVSGKRYYIG